MTAVDTLPISLATLIAVLAPGLIGLKLLYYFSDRKFSITRTRLIVYSSIISAVSAFFLYITSSILIDIFIPFIEWLAESLNTVDQTEIINISLPGGIGVYIIHILLTMFLGALAGLLFKEYKIRVENELLDRREPWEFVFTESPREGELIEVRLRNGETIHGIFNKQAFDPDNRELFLDQPYSVEYSSDKTQREDLGRTIYIHSDAIDYVVTLEEDPNVRAMESVEEFEIDEETREGLEEAIQSLSDQKSLDKSEYTTGEGENGE